MIKRPKFQWNRCAECREKNPVLMKIEGAKGTFCQECERLITLKIKRKTICIHLKLWGACRKNECVVQHIMES